MGNAGVISSTLFLGFGLLWALVLEPDRRDAESPTWIFLKGGVPCSDDNQEPVDLRLGFRVCLTVT